MTIRPVGMTLERALKIATAALPKEPRYSDGSVKAAVIRLYEQDYSDTAIAVELGIPRHKVGELRRSAGLTSNHHLKARETCKHGHPRTPENTYIDPRGGKRCRRCNNHRSLPTTNQKADNT